MVNAVGTNSEGFFLIVVTQHDNHSEAMEKYYKDSIGGQTEQRQGNHRQYFYTKGPDQRRESDDFGCVTISYLLDLPIRLYNILENSPPPPPHYHHHHHIHHHHHLIAVN